MTTDPVTSDPVTSDPVTSDPVTTNPVTGAVPDGPAPVDGLGTGTAQLVCLDMAGTTVADDGAVLDAFAGALDALGVDDHDQRARMERYVRETMGESKIRVFRALFGDETRARQANTAFEAAYERQIADGRVAPIPGAADTVTALRRDGLKVVLLTGFSASTRDRLLTALGWEDLADLTLCPSDAGRGRPFPDLVLTALLRSGADDVASVVAVGDTSSDMESARRAGAGVRAGVLTGTHDEETLRRAGATHVIDSVADLPALLGLSSGVTGR